MRNITVEKDTVLLLLTGDIAPSIDPSTNVSQDETDHSSLTFWSETNGGDAWSGSWSVGDECPIATNKTVPLAPSRDPFPVTLSVCTSDQVVYACNSTNIIVAELWVKLLEMESIANKTNDTTMLI